MAFPAIGALPQLLQLGVAAEAAGSAFAGNVASFLQAMTARISADAKPVPASPSGGKESVSQIEILPFSPPGSGFVKGTANADLTVLKQQTKTLLKRFHSELQATLSAAGINMPPGLKLSLDGFGNLQVSGDHPQASQIEEALADAPQLRSLFQKIAARSRLLGANAGSATPKTVQPTGMKSSPGFPPAAMFQSPEKKTSRSSEKAARFSLLVTADTIRPLLSN